MSTYTRGTDLVSAIICGEVNEGGDRQFLKYVPFFKDNVEVFFAEADPTKAPLFRTSLLAKHLKCNSSRIGMWLHRRKDSCDGIYQASTYLNRPAAASGLRIGAYFISLKLCEEIAEFMCKTEEKKVTRAEDTKQILPDTTYLPTIQSSSNPQAAPVFFFNPALPNGGVYHPNPAIGHTFVPNNGGFYPAHPAQFQMGSFPAAYFTPQGQIAMPAQMQLLPTNGMVMQQTSGGTISAPVSSVTPGGGVSTDVSMSVASSPSIPSSQQSAASNVSMMFVPGTDAALIALPTGSLPVQGFQYPNYQQQ